MQILVVVAIIQARSLKTEEEKGSVSTAFVHGLVGPKDQGKPVKLRGISVRLTALRFGVHPSERESG